jgi:hypothetical protein
MSRAVVVSGESLSTSNSYQSSTSSRVSVYPTTIPSSPDACHGFSVENIYNLSQGCLPTELKSSFVHIRHPRPPEPSLPLSSDHLIVLVHYNVWRACLSNILVMGLESLLNADCEMVLSKAPTKPAPPSLLPTYLQQHVLHPSWIDMFPDPQLRDNMILTQGRYNENILFSDLIGAVCTGTSTSSGRTERPSSDGLGYQDEERKGLVVWSRPWDVNSWEVTPGFLKRWGRLLHGCDALMRASNGWRGQRGEEPLEELKEQRVGLNFRISLPTERFS